MKQDGATEEEIDGLPKFKFRRVGDSEKVNGEVQAFEGFMVECDTNAPTERPISLVDAVSFLVPPYIRSLPLPNCLYL